MIGFRIVSVLFFLLGGIALFLSCIGIYAVMAFAVGRRQREIGIRVALGAQRREVLTLVVRRAAFQTTVGLVLGLLAALATTRLLGMYLYEVSPNDPATFVLTVMVLLATAVAASLVPARRAGRVDPLAALRSQ
jgi:ABC-type antimicrobial peptide transport system permease subunit